MSGKKMTDEKKQKDHILDMDSGFISGNLSCDLSSRDPKGLVEYSGELSPEDSILGNISGSSSKLTDEKRGKSEVPCVVLSGDSGLGDSSDITKSMTELKLDELLKLENQERQNSTSEPSPALQTLSPQESTFPLNILFNPDNDGDTQLHIAAVHGLEKPVSTLIRLCPSMAMLNLPNDHGLTALHLAVMSRNRIVTRMLVRSGAELGIRDRRGETPLHKATIMSDVNCIQALLMPVDNIQRKIPSINQKNYNGQACVHIAASMGHHEALQTLLFYKADVNSNENLAGRTALHIAAARGDVRMVSMLQRHAATEQRARDFAGRTPRRLARSTRAAELFTRHADSDSDTDDDDDMYDEETESLFDAFSKQSQSILA